MSKLVTAGHTEWVLDHIDQIDTSDNIINIPAKRVLAIAYSKKKNTRKALNILNALIVKNDSLGTDKRHYWGVYKNVGDYYLELNDIRKAIQSYKSLNERYKHLNISKNKARVIYKYAKALCLNREYGAAQKEIERAMIIVDIINDSELKLQLLELKGDIFLHKN